MILASGAFDGLHAGHVRHLHAAANLYPHQHLRVAVAPDSYIRLKGREPYWSQRDRAGVVGALRVVAMVYLQLEDSVASEIRRYRPNVFIKGHDWNGKLPEDVIAACQEVGAAMVFTATPGKHVREARERRI